MSVLSSLLLVFCVVSVPCYVLILLVYLLRMRSSARDTPAIEAVDNVEQSFQGETLAPAPQRRGRGSSGRRVLSHAVFDLCVILEMDLLA